jgi:hypothetical protein
MCSYKAGSLFATFERASLTRGRVMQYAIPEEPKGEFGEVDGTRAVQNLVRCPGPLTVRQYRLVGAGWTAVPQGLAPAARRPGGLPLRGGPAGSIRWRAKPTGAACRNAQGLCATGMDQNWLGRASTRPTRV